MKNWTFDKKDSEIIIRHSDGSAVVVKENSEVSVYESLLARLANDLLELEKESEQDELANQYSFDTIFKTPVADVDFNEIIKEQNKEVIIVTPSIEIDKKTKSALAKITSKRNKDQTGVVILTRETEDKYLWVETEAKKGIKHGVITQDTFINFSDGKYTFVSVKDGEVAVKEVLPENKACDLIYKNKLVGVAHSIFRNSSTFRTKLSNKLVEKLLAEAICKRH